MKKEYLDFLYETRAKLQRELDERKQGAIFPNKTASEVHSAWTEATEEALKYQDKAIETYLRVHAA